MGGPFEYAYKNSFVFHGGVMVACSCCNHGSKLLLFPGVFSGNGMFSLYNILINNFVIATDSFSQLDCSF